MTDPKRSKITDEHKEEARLLRSLWDRRSPKLTQAEFGEAYGLGNQANVGHYLHARSALNPRAAAAFARGLGCRIEDFSPRVARSLSELSTAVPEREGPAATVELVSSESLTAYVDDVSKLVGELAWNLDLEQKSTLRNLLRVMLSDKDALQSLDFRQFLPLLSDNYRPTEGRLTPEPYERRLDVRKHLDTIPRESHDEGTRHGTGSEAGAFEEGRSVRRSGKA